MKIDHGMMVIALDGRKMVLMRNEGDARYPALEVISHREAENPRTADQGSDRPGRAFSSVGPRRSAVEETDLHTLQEQEFVSTAAHSLGDHSHSPDAKFILMADPTALGHFRKSCEPALANRIVAEIPRNVAHHTTDEIANAVDAFEP